MGGLGFSELFLILLIVVVVFGATKLPQLGDGLGKAIKNFKRAVGGRDEIEVSRKKGSLEDEDKPDDEAKPAKAASDAK